MDCVKKDVEFQDWASFSKEVEIVPGRGLVGRVFV